MATALFLLDTVMNALMLALALRLGGQGIQLRRVLLGALAGAAIAKAAGALSRLQAMLVWLPAAMLMMRAAGGRARRHMLSDAARLMCAAGLAGGMVLALWGATGSLLLAYALGGCLTAGIAACALRAKRSAQPVRIRIVCTYRSKTAAFDAMIDSGNTLRDYLTHLPVIVLPEDTGRCALGIHDVPLRPIFAQTAGGRQRMHVLLPDALALEMDGKRRKTRAALALSPGMSGDVPALVPSALASSVLHDG